MKLRKDQIRLSPQHPSLLLKLSPEPPQAGARHAPLIVDQDGTLVDGYRRLQLMRGEEIEVFVMDTTNLFEDARNLNRNSRVWDALDLLLWSRWAVSLGVAPESGDSFDSLLRDAPLPLLEALAERKLEVRQAQLILQAPARYRDYFLRMLTQTLQLNRNETASLIEMSCDLANRRKMSVPDVFSETPFAEILENAALAPRQKGESLLKIMRILRYPEYQKKIEAFGALWRQLDLQTSVRIGKAQFLERGILEITLRSGSLNEMTDQVRNLSQSLESPIWDKIWEDA